MKTVTKQSEADAALAENSDAAIELLSGAFLFSISVGRPLFVVRAGVTAEFVAWESSQPRVEARESSQPRVVARESSQPRVEAWESSQPRVEAWESSQPRVVARGFVQLSLFGRRIRASASAMVSVLLDDGAACDGGSQTTVRRHTPTEWCDYYGRPVVDGVVTLYKALNYGYRSPRGGDYTPGTIPTAADWDGGKRECGGGLHFSPSVAMAMEFNAGATCFAACPVRLDDMVVHADGEYPQKVKARGCCAPVWAVDIDGERIEPAASEAA